MAVPVHDGSRVVFPGDSTAANAWYDADQSSVGGTDLLVQQLAGVAGVSRVAVDSGTRGVATGEAGRNGPATARIVAIDTGVGGWQTSDLIANFPTKVTSQAPDVVVFTVGVNDARQIPVPVTLAQFRANCDTLNTKMASELPGVPAVWMSIFCFREQWSSTPAPPHFAGNPSDSEIDSFNAEMKASALAAGFIYCDARADAGLLESVLNTPEPGAISGVLTGDQIHQNARGQRSMSDSAYPLFQFHE